MSWPGLWGCSPFPQSCWNTMSQSRWSRTSRGKFIIDSRKARAPGKVACLPLCSLGHFMSRRQSRTGFVPWKETELISPRLLIPADERDLEDFLLDFEEDLKALHSVQCSPSPGEKGIRTASAVPTVSSEANSGIFATRQDKICAIFVAHQCPFPRGPLRYEI